MEVSLQMISMILVSKALPTLNEAKVVVAQLYRLIVIPRTVAHQALLSMEFSRQEYWSG